MGLIIDFLENNESPDKSSKMLIFAKNNEGSENAVKFAIKWVRRNYIYKKNAPNGILNLATVWNDLSLLMLKYNNYLV